MPDPQPVEELVAERVSLRTPRPSMAQAFAEYLAANAERFAEAGPPRGDQSFLEAAQASIAAAQRDLERGTGLRFLVFEHGREAVIGDVSLTNIVRGVFLAGHLGYRIDAAHEGRGYMREALSCVLRHAFSELGLHRVMANYVPTNARSGALLRRLGFSVEGYARDYLFLNGRWQDHVLTSLVRPS